MKAQRANWYLGARWGWVVKATLWPLHPRIENQCQVYRRLGGPWDWSGRVQRVQLDVQSMEIYNLEATAGTTTTLHCCTVLLLAASLGHWPKKDCLSLIS